MSKVVSFSNILERLTDCGWDEERILTDGFWLFDKLKDVLRYCSDKNDFVLLLLEDVALIDELKDYQNIDRELFWLLRDSGLKEPEVYMLILQIVDVLLRLKEKYDELGVTIRREDIEKMIDNDEVLTELIERRTIPKNVLIDNVLLTIADRHGKFVQVHKLLKLMGFRTEKDFNTRVAFFQDLRDEIALIVRLIDNFCALNEN